MTFGRVSVVCAVLFVSLAAGCDGPTKSKAATSQKVLVSRYQTLPPRQVPAFLKDSIYERCDLGNTQPMVVSGFGLVANLRGTGDTFAGTNVREYLRKQMITHGLGSRVMGTENMQPEDILKDPKWAIVKVDALIPPGARRYQRLDVYVSALEGNNTTSLAHGDLYRTELKINGANTQKPGYAIDIWATGGGELFVNPAYALMTGSTEPEVRNSLRQAAILDGGVALMDRPILLRLRQPQLSMARAIQYRLAQGFQDLSVAAAKDEAIIAIYVPERYATDWDHFAQVVTHTFLNATPDFAVIKAKQLGEEALKPDAPLLDISYCWEALGPTALPFITPLMTNDKQEVAYASARAAAFLGDATAQTVLMDMARISGHPFQISAVQTLGKLPPSPEINQMLRTLLDTDQTLVRLEAYRALASHDDPSIISKKIGDGKFTLDIVPSQGPPIIYASRTGAPRIAVIGNHPKMNLPIVFSSMNNQFTISSDEQRQLLTIFYRGPELDKPIWFLSSPDAAELIARLGGEGAPGDPSLKISYCEVVALLQAMGDQKRFSAVASGKRTTAAFVLQESPRIEKAIEEAPMIPDETAAAPGDSESDKLGTNVESRMIRSHMQ
ncbi:MAG TPA: flagellar basal body P-ring protein FlgI [Tepidisphaeraceae bacterium]|jgi:hypothetical protein